MRLLDTHTLELKEFFDSQIPKYAILSHTWGEDEVSLKDMGTGKGREERGFTKIKGFVREAKRLGWKWAWMDTWCIDKSLAPIGEPNWTAALLLRELHQQRLMLIILHLNLEYGNGLGWSAECVRVADQEQARAKYESAMDEAEDKVCVSESEALVLDQEYGTLQVDMSVELLQSNVLIGGTRSIET